MNRVLKSSINNNVEDDPLQEQFKRLEMEWHIIKQSVSRSNRRNSITFFNLCNESPKKLISLLQQETASANQASSEVIEELDADSDNGGSKGRRLFNESEVGSEFDTDEKSEVSTEFSCNGFEIHDGNDDRVCMDSPVFDVAVKGGGRGGGGGGSVWKWIVCVVIMLFAFAIVALCKSEEQKHILVPT